MSDALLNLIRREVERVIRGQVGAPQTGIVDQFDPVRIAAIVTLAPDGQQTGWLPLLVQWMGNGWGEVAPLQPGDQVGVIYAQNDKSAGLILGRLYDERNQPPQGAVAGERWLVHQSGSFLKLLATGDIALTTNRDLNATVGRNLNATVAGSLTATVTGALTATVTGTAKIVSAALVQVFAPAIQLGKQAGDTLVAILLATVWPWLSTHTHSASGGTGNGGPPNSVPTESSVITSVVTAE